MKPLLILDNHFRSRAELFGEETYAALGELCRIEGGVDAPMPRARIDALLPEAAFYIATRPELSAADVAGAGQLRATIEVAGAFRDGLDYGACFDRGIEVLSCSPGFRRAVAEMALAMMLAGGRGLVEEHEAFRTGSERWLDDRPASDFSLYGQTVGFIGYGQISRETHRLLTPFAPQVLAHDPYLTETGTDARLVELTELVEESRVIVLAAVPSEDTRNLLNAALIERLQPGALVVVISRAWCADFPALIAAAEAGRIKVATDVFPSEPLDGEDPLRRSRNVILSPHRAAAVPGGRQLIGEMILHDVRAILEGRPERQLKAAEPALVAGLVAAQQHMNAMPNT
ncbi:MAG: NAD(P)-dependent oxidoreductase [Pseudomonadota bacterium]